MSRLSISLEEGFTGETVVVSVNGAEVYRRDHVKTKLQIGLAEQFELEVQDGPASIEVTLPAKQLSGRSDVDVAGELYVGVNVEGNEIRFRHSSHTFGYV